MRSAEHALASFVLFAVCWPAQVDALGIDAPQRSCTIVGITGASALDGDSSRQVGLELLYNSSSSLLGFEFLAGLRGTQIGDPQYARFAIGIRLELIPLFSAGYYRAETAVRYGDLYIDGGAGISENAYSQVSPYSWVGGGAQIRVAPTTWEWLPTLAFSYRHESYPHGQGLTGNAFMIGVGVTRI